MTLLRRIAGLWRTLFRSQRLDADLDDELRAYLRDSTERKIRDGLDPAVAHREAARAMGNLDWIREETRSARIGVGVE